MISRNRGVIHRKRLDTLKASLPSKQSMARAARSLAPTLFFLALASAAHAQGTMDFSGAQTLMGTFKNFTVDRQIEPLVMGSEIGGLDDRHAYLKLGNDVARFDFDYLDLPTPTPGFLPRRSADGEMSFDPDTLKPRRANTARPPAESEVASGGGAPLAHKIEKQTPSESQIEQAAGVVSEVTLAPDCPESISLPHGPHHHALETPLDDVEHAIHPGIF